MRILDRIPVINIFACLLDWANGDEYTTDDSIILTPELAESDKKTDKIYDEHFETPTSKGNSGKGKAQFRVEEGQLNPIKTIDLAQTLETNQKERDGRD